MLKKVYAVVGIGLTLFARKCILSLKIKRQYKNLGKLDCAIAKLNGMLFNPYRISNGFGSIVGMQNNNATCISRENLEKCHEIIRQKRENKI
jgi:hypothetical protein